MIANKLFKLIILIVYLCMTLFLLSSCANSNSQNNGIGEEYGASDRAWY